MNPTPELEQPTEQFPGNMTSVADTGAETIAENAQENPFEILQKIIDGGPQKIEEEFAKTTNTWAQSYASVVTILLGKIENGILKGVEPEKEDSIRAKIAALRKRVDGARILYSTKGKAPEGDRKKTFYDALRILD